MPGHCRPASAWGGAAADRSDGLRRSRPSPPITSAVARHPRLDPRPGSAVPSTGLRVFDLHQPLEGESRPDARRPADSSTAAMYRPAACSWSGRGTRARTRGTVRVWRHQRLPRQTPMSGGGRNASVLAPPGARVSAPRVPRCPSRRTRHGLPGVGSAPRSPFVAPLPAAGKTPGPCGPGPAPPPQSARSPWRRG